MSEIAYYQPHLDRVSRSFAFCIARLEGEMREWVSLSYLLCRLLDTVEDAPWADPRAPHRARIRRPRATSSRSGRIQGRSAESCGTLPGCAARFCRIRGGVPRYMSCQRGREIRSAKQQLRPHRIAA